jgi:hypothetical protein
MSEYVGAYAQRLEWLTGFGGSAGTAVVLRQRGDLRRRALHLAGARSGRRRRYDIRAFRDQPGGMADRAGDRGGTHRL